MYNNFGPNAWEEKGMGASDYLRQWILYNYLDIGHYMTGKLAVDRKSLDWNQIGIASYTKKHFSKGKYIPYIHFTTQLDFMVVLFPKYNLFTWQPFYFSGEL